MDMNERIRLAKAELAGCRVRVVKKGRGKKDGRPKKIRIVKEGKFRDGQSARDVYLQCGKKVRYRSESEARVYANNAETRRGQKLRVYGPCPICNGWHITKRLK